MTDLEICIAAMTDWPEKSRPVGLLPNLGQAGFCLAPSGCQRIPDDHAIALFRDSGLGWLAENSSKHISFTPENAGWTVWVCDDDMHSGPTLLSAIDASIRSARGDKA